MFRLAHLAFSLVSKLAFHWQILIGAVAGILFGIVVVQFGWDRFSTNWIKPWGILFVNALKLIAVPLVVASLIKGISDLKNISQLSSLGGRTMLLYVITTVVAATIGLLIVNVVKPGDRISVETRDELAAKYDTGGTDTEGSQKIADAKAAAAEQKKSGPLQPLMDVIPDNVFGASTENRNLLQVIFFVVLFGIGLILIPQEKAKPVKDFFDGINEVILKIVNLIMVLAPIGVFALLCSLVVDTQDLEVFKALLTYCVCVLVGLGFMMLLFYPTLVRVFAGKKISFFFRGIAPAQLLAFSTSSSAATLPLTKERVVDHLGVEDDVAGFVLPIGTTINMDGTCVHQAISAVFIAQAFGMDLSLTDQITIVIMATMVSIGAPAVPSAGLVMLVIVLESIGAPQAGLALIFAVDRILDMCRTSVNVTGDATVSMLVAKSVGKLGEPHIKVPPG